MALALPIFAITLFVSAFLLFLVQPMIGKMVLPKLGGTPQVWNTCMLFFQSALLLGYGYTHAVSTRLPLRRQLLVHSIVLAIPLLFLFPPIGPFNVGAWDPPAGTNPIWSTLLMLTLVVGIPFFVVSTSAPLLQRWFAYTGHASSHDPYFLYSASNLGSLLSLIAYPFVVEPWVDLRPTQAWTWAILYLVLAGLILYCVSLVWKTAPALQLVLDGAEAPPLEMPVPPASEPTPAPAPAPETGVKAGPAPSASQKTGITRKKGLKVPVGKPTVTAHEPSVDLEVRRTDAVTNWRRLRWVLLAFAPSSLMLGVTSYISIDLSPFPLLWVIPLALYLITFILVFAKWPVPWVGTPHRAVLLIQPVFIAGMCMVYLSGFSPGKSVFFSIAGFFMAALLCHGELAVDRPTPKHLTEFFLWMSVGGMLGGLFNGMLAPQLFVGVVEYPITIIVACLLRPTQKVNGWFDELLLSAFPSFATSVRDTGDKVALSFKQQPPQSNWLLNYSLDILFAIFILGLSLFIRNKAEDSWDWFVGNLNSDQGIRAMEQYNGLYKVYKFIGFEKESALRWTESTRLSIVLVIPLIFCFFFAIRPLRFGLAIAAFLFAHLVLTGRDGRNVYADRSYFGVLRVRFGQENVQRSGEPEVDFSFFARYGAAEKERASGKIADYTTLLHGTTDHGHNYHAPVELRRLATTYYHRKGPVGTIMERFNWGSIVPVETEKDGKKVTTYKNVAKQNTYYADNRLPASMVGLAASPYGVGSLPVDLLTAVWSEPPYATIGLGTGTMVSYARPFQHMTYYEIDEKIRNFSLPPIMKYTMKVSVLDESGKLNEQRDPFFVYLTDAVARGVNLEVIMGDARFSMEKENHDVSKLYSRADKDAENTYFKANDLPSPQESHFSKRDAYYKVIVVDAFSSDAIPVHLITKEAIELYFSKLAPDGVLCVHTSNRHLDLVWPVTSIARDMKKAFLVGRDRYPPFLGHTSSEYVMLAHEEKYLQTDINMPGTVIQWHRPAYPDPLIWTDNYSNIVKILR